METKNANQIVSGNSQALISSSAGINFRNLYLLNGNTLLPLAPEYLNSYSPAEKNFRSAKELEELVLGNSKTLFGQHTFLVTFEKKDGALFGNDFVPSGFMLDVGNPAKPRVYILDIMLAKQSFFGYVFPRITKFFSLLKSEENIEKLCELIGKDKEFKKVLQVNVESGDTLTYLKNAITGKPIILLVMDSEMKEMPEVMETYSETWQRVKLILLQKYASNGNTFLTMHSPFNLANRVNHKERVIREKITYTEERHLERTSDDMRAVYAKLKSDIQKIDAEVKFNPQKYYISLHKNRNLAFFHFKRKKISIVVMTTDKDARKVVIHHKVKTLAASVQKFWNGSSCAVDIENVKHLNEITSLLKKLIAE